MIIHHPAICPQVEHSGECVKENREIVVEKALRDFDVEVLWTQVCVVKKNYKVPVKCNKCEFHSVRSISDLKKGKFFCYGCFVKHLDDISTTTQSILKYESGTLFVHCLVCRKQYTTKVSGTYKSDRIAECPHCNKNELIKLVESKGFCLISKNYSKSTLRCNTCCTVKTLSTSTMLRGEFSCKHCRETFKENLHLEGFYYNNALPLGKYLFTCIQCGYWKCVDFSSISRSSAKCLNCRSIRYQKVLEDKGCTLVGKQENLIVFNTSEGRKLSIPQSQILSGRFNHTGDNHWYRPACLYVMLNMFNGRLYCKIGTSSEPERRLKELQLEGINTIQVMKWFATRKEADSLEKYVHKNLRQYSVKPKIAEIFTRRVTARGVKDGITEWFNPSILKKIWEVINEFDRHTKSSS